MLPEIKTKIRALIEDLTKIDIEIFEYTTSSTFTLSEENISSIVKVDKNGIALGSGDYSFDSTTNEIEITTGLSSGDIITVKYQYTKYSDTELIEYIRAALIWISLSALCEKDFELETDYIEPTPCNKEEDLIAIVSSILIKPDYSEYRLPNITVRYPRTMTKEERIQKLISKFYHGTGVNNILEWD
jgi:hypothetical protein